MLCEMQADYWATQVQLDDLNETKWWLEREQEDLAEVWLRQNEEFQSLLQEIERVNLDEQVRPARMGCL